MDESLKQLKSENDHFIQSLNLIIKTNYPQLSTEASTLLNTFVSTSDQMYLLAPQYDYNNIQANGKRSLLKFANNFLKKASSSTQTKDDISEILNGIEFFILSFNYSIAQHESTNDDKSSLNVVNELLVNLEKNVEKYMKTFLKNGYFSCNCQELTIVLQFFLRLGALVLNPFNLQSLLSFILPHNLVVDSFVTNSSMSTPQTVARFIRLPDLILSRFFTRILFLVQNPISGLSITRKTINLDVNSPYLIGVDEKSMYTKLIKRTVRTKTNVRFRVLSTKGHFYGKVIFYCHGGGFLGPSAESLEDLYIVDWALALPGVTIINVDYSLAPESKFPTQTQEILDCYLWLQSESEEVKKVLGFIPTDVVLAGDSAGANLTLSLALMINDLHEEFNATSIKLPKSIVGMFGKYYISKELSSSHFLSIGDQLVSFLFLLRMASYMKFRVYSSLGLNNNENKQTGKTWKLMNLDNVDGFMTNPNIEPDPSPYLQPSKYHNFSSDALKSIRLYLMSIDACPLLDESIELAKNWKGKVKLVHIENTCHGSLYFVRMHPSATKNIMKTSIDLLNEAFKE